MADISKIYEQYGIEGLIPYAYANNTPAYKLITDEIKTKGTPLYCEFLGDMNFPKIRSENGVYFIACYTKNKEDSFTDGAAITYVETAEKFYDLMKAVGIKKIKVNDAAMIDIADLSSISNQLNSLLTADMLYASQNGEDANLLLNRLYSTSVYTPVVQLKDDDISIVTLRSKDMEYIAAFTSEMLCDKYAGESGLFELFVEISFQELIQASEERGFSIMINPGCCDILLSEQKMETVPSEDDDAMPDFLR